MSQSVSSYAECILPLTLVWWGGGLSHDSFGARMGGTPERLYKCTQENLQVSSTTRPCLSQTGAGWCLTPEEGRVAESVVDTPRVSLVHTPARLAPARPGGNSLPGPARFGAGIIPGSARG